MQKHAHTLEYGAYRHTDAELWSALERVSLVSCASTQPPPPPPPLFLEIHALMSSSITGHLCESTGGWAWLHCARTGHPHTETHTDAHTHTQTHTHTHTHTHTRTHTHTHTYIHTYIHTYTRTHTNAYTPKDTHAHAHKRRNVDSNLRIFRETTSRWVSGSCCVSHVPYCFVHVLSFWTRPRYVRQCVLSLTAFFPFLNPSPRPPPYLVLLRY
jgi:hypothetical protein